MLNARRTDLEKLIGLLPALQRPTVSSLSDPDWVAINTILEEKTARDLIRNSRWPAARESWNIR